MCGHVCQHVYGHVYEDMRGHVYGHVYHVGGLLLMYDRALFALFAFKCHSKMIDMCPGMLMDALRDVGIDWCIDMCIDMLLEMYKCL